MEKARLGRWHFFVCKDKIPFYQFVEMEKARLGRWHIQLPEFQLSSNVVEMEKARLGRWH